MRNIALLIEYDGTAYAGWQIQENARTIQQVIEEELTALCRTPVRIHGAGRTDAGVHAEGQVCTFQTDADLPMSAFSLGLNTKLPPDVRVLEAREMPAEFHARFSARRKCYIYRVLARPVGSALLRDRAWHVRREVDWPAVRAALGDFVGEHDFAAFQSSGADTSTTVREIYSADYETAGPVHEFRFVGSGFLKGQVRSMIGTLIEIGLGKLPAGHIEGLLSRPERSEAGTTAPPQGLTMAWVDFGEGPWTSPGGGISPVISGGSG